MIEITIPTTKTEIRLNVSGKTVGEIANELSATAEILRTIQATNDPFVEGIPVAYYTEEEASKAARPLPRIHYEPWAKDAPGYSGPIVLGYWQRGAMLRIDIAPDFMAWARTDKPLDEFCKKQIEEIRGALEEEQR